MFLLTNASNCPQFSRISTGKNSSSVASTSFMHCRVPSVVTASRIGRLVNMTRLHLAKHNCSCRW